MTNGVFQTGETVKGTVNNNEFSFRLASPNHKEGPYNAPTKVATLNPYLGGSLVFQLYIQHLQLF